MNIAQFSYLYYPSIGGVESVVKNISEILVSRNHDVDVLCSNFVDLKSTKQIEEQNKIINGVNVHRIAGEKKRFLNRWSAQNISFSIKNYKYLLYKKDILHIHSFPSSFYFDIINLADIKSQKIFLHGHYSPHHLEMYKSAYRSLYWEKKVIPLFDKIYKYVAIVPQEAKVLNEVWNIPKEKIVVIPNGVNMIEMQQISLSRSELLIKYKIKNDFVVLTVARITYSKGIDILLKTAQELNENTNHKISFVIAGIVEDVKYYNQLINFIKKNSIENVILLDVNRQEIINLFNACDLFVLPSRGEVFGIALIEAMACGKPCIGTNYGGIPDVVKDNYNGLLFELNSHIDLAQKILFLKENKLIMDLMRRRNKMETPQKFNWNSIVDQLLAAYRN